MIKNTLVSNVFGISKTFVSDFLKNCDLYKTTIQILDLFWRILYLFHVELLRGAVEQDSLSVEQEPDVLQPDAEPGARLRDQTLHLKQIEK